MQNVTNIQKMTPRETFDVCMLYLGLILLICSGAMYGNGKAQLQVWKNQIKETACVGTVRYTDYQWVGEAGTAQCSAAAADCEAQPVIGPSFTVTLTGILLNVTAAEPGLCGDLAPGSVVMLRHKHAAPSAVRFTCTLVDDNAVAQYHVYPVRRQPGVASSSAFNGNYPFYNNTAVPAAPKQSRQFAENLTHYALIVAVTGFALWCCACTCNICCNFMVIRRRQAVRARTLPRGPGVFVGADGTWMANIDKQQDVERGAVPPPSSNP